MTQQRTLTRRSGADLALLALIWGGSFLSIRIALNDISVLSSVVHRVGWAALLLWAVVLATGLPIPRAPRVWAAFLVMGLLNNVIPFSLMTWGQLHIETGLTSILNAATAIFGVLAAAIFLSDERLTPQKLTGVSIGFAGVVVIIGRDALASFDPRSLGQLAVLAGTVSYALASVWARTRLSHLPPQVAAAGMLTGSTAVMIPATLLIEGQIDWPSTPVSALAVAYYAIVATALAYLLYYRIIAAAGAGNALLVTLLIPPVAIALGAVVLGERLGPNAFAGLALLVVGLLILSGRLWPRARSGTKSP